MANEHSRMWGTIQKQIIIRDWMFLKLENLIISWVVKIHYDILSEMYYIHQYTIKNNWKLSGYLKIWCNAKPWSTLLILIDDGAPGKPGKHVLKAVTSLNGPRPQALIPATRNLYAVPGNSSTRVNASWLLRLTTSMSWNTLIHNTSLTCFSDEYRMHSCEIWCELANSATRNRKVCSKSAEIIIKGVNTQILLF